MVVRAGNYDDERPNRRFDVDFEPGYRSSSNGLLRDNAEHHSTNATLSPSPYAADYSMDEEAFDQFGGGDDPVKLYLREIGRVKHLNCELIEPGELSAHI